MENVLRVTLLVIAVVGSGMIAGVFFAVAVSVLPTLFTIPADRYVEMHQKLGKGYHPAMPLIANITMIADIVLAVLAPTTVTRALFIAVVVLIVGVQCVSHLANVPINRQVHAVDSGAIPEDWPDPRPLWQNWHRLRTAFALLALTGTAFAIAVTT